MTETAEAFYGPDIGYCDIATPDTYPHVAELSVGNPDEERRLVAVGTWHFTSPSGSHGWQFAPLCDILTHTVAPQSEADWIVLTEGNVVKRRQRVHPDMSFTDALATEHEMGMLVLQAKLQGQPVGTWDILMGQEMGMFLRLYNDPASSLPGEFRRLWESSDQLAQWLYYHAYGKVSYQYLRHLEQGTAVESNGDYVTRILKAHGVDKIVARYHIDPSDTALSAVHDAVCREAGFAKGLPLDPHEALVQAISSDTYAGLHFTQPRPHGGYLLETSRLRQMGDMASTTLRNTHLANVAIRCLAPPNPKNVLLFAGGSPPGRHIINGIEIMRKSDISMNNLRWHIGAKACEAYATNN
jgi:hypothetical protein